MPQKLKEHHTKAAEHHEHAAKHHRKAAEHHGSGKHETAHELHKPVTRFSPGCWERLLRGAPRIPALTTP